MRLPWILVSLAALFSTVAFAADPAPNLVPAAAAKTAKEPKESGFVFSLLPKSLQRNPRLSFNIFTEMTAEGRKVRQPTPQAPAYYIAQAAGVYHGGVGAEHDLKSPPVEKLEMMMKRALAESGYLPSENATQPPTLAIIYHWG